MDVSDLVKLRGAAEALLAKIKPQTAILLTGPLGAGKTEFSKMVVESRFKQSASSPTFAIHQRYFRGETNEAGYIDHFDLYRLKNPDDLESTGFWDIVSEPAELLLIEWADRLRDWGFDPVNELKSRGFVDVYDLFWTVNTNQARTLEIKHNK